LSAGWKTGSKRIWKRTSSSEAFSNRRYIVTSPNRLLNKDSLLLGGVVAELTGNKVLAIFALCGIMTSVLTVLVSVGRDFREFPAYEDKPEESN
jgi:hypothetical protein